MTRKEVRPKLVMAPVHILSAPRAENTSGWVVTDPPRTGKTPRSQEALGGPEGRAGPGNKGREVTENKAPAVELGQRIVGMRMAAPRGMTPLEGGYLPTPAETQPGRNCSQKVQL